jgi:hypothetical protein
VRALEQRFDGCSDGHMIGAEYLNSRTTMSQDVFTIGTVLRF